MPTRDDSLAVRVAIVAGGRLASSSPRWTSFPGRPRRSNYSESRPRVAGSLVMNAHRSGTGGAMREAGGSLPDILVIRVAPGVLTAAQPCGPGGATQRASGPFPGYGYYSTPQLLAAFGAGPARMRTAVEGLSEPEVRARPRREGKWSIHEIVMHTADSELQGTLRVRKMLAESSAMLPGFSQDLWARALNYQEQSDAARERALSLVTLLRQQNLPLLEGATPEDWARSGTHPTFGVVTLRNMLELYADHVERHIEQILDSRARLGRPLEMEAILPRRLY